MSNIPAVNSKMRSNGVDFLYIGGIADKLLPSKSKEASATEENAASNKS